MSWKISPKYIIWSHNQYRSWEVLVCYTFKDIYRIVWDPFLRMRMLFARPAVESDMSANWYVFNWISGNNDYDVLNGFSSLSQSDSFSEGKIALGKSVLGYSYAHSKVTLKFSRVDISIFHNLIKIIKSFNRQSYHYRYHKVFLNKSISTL